MPKSQNQTLPARLDTVHPDLTLVQMTTAEDDKAFFNLQKQNQEFWAEFGNAIYSSVEDVTRSRINKGNRRFGIYLDDQLIGMEGSTLSKDGKEAEVGICLDKNASSKGYASAAIKALSEFLQPDFERVYAEIDVNNSASRRLFERNSYIKVSEGELRDWGRIAIYEFTK